MTNELCVVLGDVVDSQKIADRRGFKTELERTLGVVNEQYAETIHAPFKTLKGIDEFGGVLSSISSLVDIQRTLSRHIHPESARIAAVIGEIDVNPQSTDVAQMDGAAFARADVVLSELEAEGTTFRLRGTAGPTDDLLSELVTLLDIVRSEWSPRQMEVLRAYERLGSQTAVAEEFDITVQAVSNHLNRSHIDTVRTIERRVSKTLQQYGMFE